MEHKDISLSVLGKDFVLKCEGIKRVLDGTDDMACRISVLEKDRPPKFTLNLYCTFEAWTFGDWMGFDKEISLQKLSINFVERYLESGKYGPQDIHDKVVITSSNLHSYLTNLP